jgi:hypothetical protein
MTTMKTGIKALSLSLALSSLALLGACSSVNSTPDSELPTGENSVILENAEEKGTEAVEGLSPDATTGEATDGITEGTATETEATDTETAEEVDPTEIMLPEGDSAEVETDSEAS